MSWLRACRLADLTVGAIKAVTVAGEPLLLCRTAAGEFHAVENLCSHDEAPLGEGDLDGVVITCPRHGAQFDVRTGVALRLPAAVPLVTYQVRIAADEWIEVALAGEV